MLHHLDLAARGQLSMHYAELFEHHGLRLAPAAAGGPTPLPSVLDLCSSWVSHFPAAVAMAPPAAEEVGEVPGVVGRVVGIGMNDAELEANPVLSGHILQDLNVQPRLSLPDGGGGTGFDVVVSHLDCPHPSHFGFDAIAAAAVQILSQSCNLAEHGCENTVHCGGSSHARLRWSNPLVSCRRWRCQSTTSRGLWTFSARRTESSSRVGTLPSRSQTACSRQRPSACGVTATIMRTYG